MADTLWKNRYLIEKKLGRGGFGVVYLASDQQLLSKRVVIKVLQDESNPDPYLQKKFRQEIEASARLDYPGIVGVLDVGDTPEGKPFLVMQYIDGVTLGEEIGKAGMDFKRAAHILRQVAQALAAAHEKGVFHRDLKPDNIMLTRSSDTEEYVRLIDFGIAAVMDSQVTAMGEPSKVVGTPLYMAPEQVLGMRGAASDVYSLGVIAFQMLTGHRPEISTHGVAVKPRQIRPEIPGTPASAAGRRQNARGSRRCAREYRIIARRREESPRRSRPRRSEFAYGSGVEPVETNRGRHPR